MGPQDPQLGDPMRLRRRPSPLPSQRPRPRAGRAHNSSERIDLVQGSDPWGSALFLEPGQRQGSILGWQHPRPRPQASFTRQPRPPHRTGVAATSIGDTSAIGMIVRNTKLSPHTPPTVSVCWGCCHNMPPTRQCHGQTFWRRDGPDHSIRGVGSPEASLLSLQTAVLSLCPR